MNGPLITVIVPVYQAERYLSQCVDSILNQTYRNLEIILVDDGSQDASGYLCDLYKNKDSRVVVEHQINGGPSAARNKGIKLAKGDYIGFVDADDCIRQDMYEILESFVRLTGADLIKSSYRAVFEKRGDDLRPQTVAQSPIVLSGRDALLSYLDNKKRKCSFFKYGSFCLI